MSILWDIVVYKYVNFKGMGIILYKQRHTIVFI